MKILLVTISILTGSAGTAQKNQLFLKPKTLLEIVKEKNIDPNKNSALKFKAQPTGLLFEPNAKFISILSNGNVYALPHDNMPCFVATPNNSANIRNKKIFSFPSVRIPNPLKK
jgi:hypothetical protein